MDAMEVLNLAVVALKNSGWTPIEIHAQVNIFLFEAFLYEAKTVLLPTQAQPDYSENGGPDAQFGA
jgi:hypothetical protein